jgi:hypothetical protein
MTVYFEVLSYAGVLTIALIVDPIMVQTWTT